MHALKSAVVNVLFICCLTQCLQAQSHTLPTTGYELEIPQNLTVAEQWQNFEKSIKGIVGTLVKMILPQMMEVQTKMNISTQCMRDGMQLIAGVRNIKPWAMRFLDASGKMIDGIMVGSVSNFGAYDECVDTTVTSERSRDKGKTLFRGKYCSIDMKPPLPPKRKFYKLDEVLEELKNFSKGGTVISEIANYAQFLHFMSLRLGVCVPSGCTLEDMDQVAKPLGKMLSLNARVTRCELKQENNYTPVVIFIMSLYSFAGFLMLVGSLIDLYSYYTKTIFRNKAIQALIAFSILTNFRKFASTKTSTETLSCLHGVRFLCISWVVLGHTYLIVNYQMFLGLEKVRDYAKDFAFQAVVNASVAVDTFFFMGGLLVCYLAVKFVKIGGHPFSIKLYIFHRLWRIMPVYIFVILFMFMANILGSGPIWYESTHKYIQACYDNWWTNLIFINNFYNAEQMCIPQSWYIACDFQLYIAALLIVIPLLKWPKVGISLSVMGILASIVYCGVGTYVNDYPPTMLFVHPDPEQRNEYWAQFYFRPFVHASPYCIGILAGYLLAMKPDLKIPRSIQVLGWCLAFIFNFSVLYGVVEWNRGREPDFWESMIYSSLNRTAWTLGVAWMIVCCATGHGGVINYILSWKPFIPLGRLTFVVYLIHPIVQIACMGNVRTQLQPDHFLAVWIFFGHLCVTYATAFAGSMLVEAPVLALEKIIIPRRGKKTDNPSLVNEKNNILKGTLQRQKNGELAVIVPDTTSEPDGIDNIAVVYKL